MTETIISQNETNVNDIPCVKICREKKTAEGFAAAEILTGSNELAADILAMNGFKHLDSEGFAEIHTPMEFYGVSFKYYTSLLNRYNITLKYAPSEVIKKYGETYLSARMILALCMMMQQGRNIPADSKAKEVYLRLRDTSYYKKGLELARAEKRKDLRYEDAKRKAEKVIQEGLLDDGELPEITPDGKVLITVGGLAKLVGMMNTSSPCKRLNEAIEQFSPKTEDDSTKIEGNLPESKEDQTRKTRKRSGGRYAPVPVIATKDGVSTRYESMIACARAIGGTSGNVSMALQAPHYRVKGYTITYA